MKSSGKYAALPDETRERFKIITDERNAGLLTAVQWKEFERNCNGRNNGYCEDDDSPICSVVGHVGNYWRNGILSVLYSSPSRPSTIVRLLWALNPARPISQRMLYMNLHLLQRDGLVTRETIDAKHKHVEYSLTPAGYQLMEYVRPLLDWIFENGDQVAAARRAFDDENGSLPWQAHS